MNILLAIFIGGGLGSVTRFAVSKSINSSFDNINPIATLTSNVISTIILGVVIYLFTHKIEVPNYVRALIIVGFCGGFSTFSTFSFETYELFRSGYTVYAILNILVSVLLGVGIMLSIPKIF